jgi:uncharacterized membrane protein YhiD involved in acid resistance
MKGMRRVGIPDHSRAGQQFMLNDIKARLAGLALVAVGLGAGWFFVLKPLQEAMAGAAEVDYSPKAFLFVPASVLFGMAFLLGGARFRYRDEAHKNFTATGWLLLIIIAVVTGAGFWWFNQQLAAGG